MEIVFKIAEAKDCPIIRQLAERIWDVTYKDIIPYEQLTYMMEWMYSFEGIKKQMDEGHAFFVVYKGEKPIGYVSVSTNGEGKYFIHKIYIDIAEQDQGIGAKMFGYILKKYKNVESIELTVNRKNFKAIDFYFKNGFAIERVVDINIWNGYFMNDFVMTKKVNEYAS